MSKPTIHMWGLYDVDGNPCTPSGASVTERTVHATHKAVEENIARHGGVLADLYSTRTLDGWLVATEFDVPDHEGADRMWHQIAQAREPWGSIGDEQL